MKNRKHLKYFLLLLILTFIISLPMQAHAYTGFKKSGNAIQYYNKSGNLVKGTWIHLSSGSYYANANGNLAKGLVTINNKLYFFTSSGLNLTGWLTIDGNVYYFLKTTREAVKGKAYTFPSGKTYYFDENGIRQTGWVKIDDHSYYFKPYLRTGWFTIDNKKYYGIRTTSRLGERAEGIFSIAGKIYYFQPGTGVLQTNTKVTVNGRTYKIDANGVCTVTTMTKAPSAEMLFFLTFESGSSAYNQTGGDHGNACGAYQFDYRYSLLPFVKYAYAKNPTLCAEFKKYAKLTTGTSLHSNSAFYKAWNKIYQRSATEFAALQDTYARVNYYDNVERSLQNSGIDIASRPDVVKGAIFSYSIQHGQQTAVAAVKAVKLSSSMSSKVFLKKLYNYRISSYPLYSSRYTAEYKLALTFLN